ncbi:universal stress protein [Nesterenkonia suensis]
MSPHTDTSAETVAVTETATPPVATTSALRRILVGYGGDERSRDAVRLGVALARAAGAHLHLQLILRQDSSFTPAYPPVGDVGEIIADQARGWLAEAQEMIPDDVAHSSAISPAASVAEGLIAAAQEQAADLLVTGSGVGARRLTTHPAVDALLHSSPVPLALAPAGHRGETPVDHMLAAVSPGRSVHQIAADAAAWAAQLQVPVSQVTFPQDGDPARAVAAHDWPAGGLLMMGSSRLAGRRRLFLGDTAARILTQLPIPLIVMPRHDTPDHRNDHRNPADAVR